MKIPPILGVQYWGYISERVRVFFGFFSAVSAGVVILQAKITTALPGKERE